MDQELKGLKNKIEEQAIKIEAIYKSVEKTRKYFLITLWTTLILFFLPFIALIFVIPKFLNIYSDLGI